MIRCSQVLLVIILLLATSCSVIDPEHNKEILPGVRQKFFADGEEKDSHQKFIKKCSGTNTVPKMKLIAQKKIDAFQTIGITNKPLILRDKVIILTSAGKLVAYDLNLDKELWSKELKKGDAKITVGKLAVEDNILYVTYGINKLTAFNSDDGKEVWTATLDDIVKGTPTVYRDKVFVHSSHNHIYALKKCNGKIIWRHVDADHIQSTFTDFSPVVYDNKVLFQIANNEIIVLDIDTGTVNKIFTINNQYGFKSNETQKYIPNHFFIENGVIFTNSKDGKLIAIDYKKQQELWHQKINSSSKFFLYGSTIYTITNQEELAAINKKTGKIECIIDLNSCTKSKNTYHRWTKPVIQDSTILVTSYDGFVLKFDLKTGRLLAEAGGMEFVTSSPAVYNRGIFIISNNGNIYKYQ